MKQYFDFDLSRLLFFCVLLTLFCSSAQANSINLPFFTPMSENMVVLDAHEESLRTLYDRGLSYQSNSSILQGGIKKWKSGGLNTIWIAAWINPARQQGEAAKSRTLALIKKLNQEVEASRGELVFCDKASDVRNAVASGKIAILLGIEGGISLNDNLDNIRMYRKLGVRRLNLTWNGDLDWAGAAYANPNNRSAKATGKGLNEFGVKVVKTLNNNGIVVDCSHASDQTIQDVLKVSSKPIICSHSNSRTLCAVPRNISDELIREIAAHGGVVGINFYPPHLSKTKSANVDTVVQHIRHVVSIAGIDHVGIGSDWDGIEMTARGLNHAGKFQNLVSALKKAGFSDVDLRKILGENFMRVLKENE